MSLSKLLNMSKLQHWMSTVCHKVLADSHTTLTTNIFVFLSSGAPHLWSNTNTTLYQLLTTCNQCSWVMYLQPGRIKILKKAVKTFNLLGGAKIVWVWLDA